jgi:hypothetical protein
LRLSRSPWMFLATISFGSCTGGKMHGLDEYV